VSSPENTTVTPLTTGLNNFAFFPTRNHGRQRSGLGTLGRLGAALRFILRPSFFICFFLGCCDKTPGSVPTIQFRCLCQQRANLHCTVEVLQFLEGFLGDVLPRRKAELLGHQWAKIRPCKASFSHLASTARNRLCAWSPRSSDCLIESGSKLAVHSRYTVFGFFRFFQGLGERPGPCKYYVSLYAIFLSRR
jgi:hypothetical protein